MMNRRNFLVSAIKGLGFLSMVAFTYPFIGSMFPSARALNDSLALIEMPKLEPGIVYSVDVKGMKLFVLKPSEEQVASIKQLDPYVSDKAISSYREDVGAYVYWAYSSRWGCPLEHQPPQAAGFREWVPNAEWLGGYWDWRCEVSYDYAGRAIDSYKYTFNGFTWPGRGLITPTVFEKSGSKYVVSIYQR